VCGEGAVVDSVISKKSHFLLEVGRIREFWGPDYESIDARVATATKGTAQMERREKHKKRLENKIFHRKSNHGLSRETLARTDIAESENTLKKKNRVTVQDHEKGQLRRPQAKKSTPATNPQLTRRKGGKSEGGNINTAEDFLISSRKTSLKLKNFNICSHWTELVRKPRHHDCGPTRI